MTVSKLERKGRPTNLDLQEQVAEVHECLENVGKQVDAQGQKLATHSQHLVAIADAMGVRLPTEDELARGEPVKRISRRLGGLPTWHAAAIAIGAIAAGMTIYKVLEPAVVAFGLALHHALMGH